MDVAHQFVVTDCAREYLRAHQYGWGIIARAKDYCHIVTAKTLEFFNTFQKIVCDHHDIRNLWGLGELPRCSDLSLLSRTISTIKYLWRMPDELLNNFLQMILECDSIYILGKMCSQRLSLEKIVEAVPLIMQQPADERSSLLSTFVDYMSTPEHLEYLRWLINCPKGKRQQVSQCYRRLKTVIDKMNGFENADIKNDLHSFLRKVKYDILCSINLDKNIVEFQNDIHMMAAQDQGQWITIFMEKYGNVSLTDEATR
ncbi:MAG: hypothetical protein Q8K36_04000 [Alphaproteobacteria bacterium]|nr:hypothetical protein [Alphaproteobacteria bacterium]